MNDNFCLAPLSCCDVEKLLYRCVERVQRLPGNAKNKKTITFYTVKDTLQTLNHITRHFKQELPVYERVIKDPRTPKSARAMLRLAVGYTRDPFARVPIVGYLHRILIVPLLVLTALKRIPPAVLKNAQKF
jgi:uncharacterized membrane protein YkvA (DUF1232 family)